MKNLIAIGQDILEAQSCTREGCNCLANGLLAMSAICHPRSGLIVVYAKGTGFLQLRCHACDDIIARVAVREVSLTEEVPAAPAEPASVTRH